MSCQCETCGRFPDYYQMFKDGVPEEDQPKMTCFSCREDENCSLCPMGNKACPLFVPSVIDMAKVMARK